MEPRSFDHVMIVISLLRSSATVLLLQYLHLPSVIIMGVWGRFEIWPTRISTASTQSDLPVTANRTPITGIEILHRTR
jgi:hypothetical protein